MKFELIGECEHCRKEVFVSSTNICKPCLGKMLEIKDDPVQRKKRLGELNRSENAIRIAVRNEMTLRTSQSTPSEGINLNRLMDERDRKRVIRAASVTKFWELAKKLTDARDVTPLITTWNDVNSELIKYLANKPEDFYKLHPRKFEEVVCEILTDQGHTVELTPQSRDGGRDLVVIMKTQLGEMLVVVECKRWATDNPVGLDVIERFLFHIRDKSRASYGLIVATTRFTKDAIKAAQEYKYQLRLSDIDALSEMAQNYGKWKKNKSSNLWIPNY